MIRDEIDDFLVGFSMPATLFLDIQIAEACAASLAGRLSLEAGFSVPFRRRLLIRYSIVESR